MEKQVYHSGFVTLLGRSNVGKSTLVNALVGEKVSIVSDKPQTTRNQVRGVLTRPEYQIVFIDTPGVHKPRTRLGTYMVKAANQAVGDIDCLVVVLDASAPFGGGDRAVMEQAGKSQGVPVIVALNKIDLIPHEKLLALMEQLRGYDFIREILPISAKLGEGLQELEALLVSFLPEGPMYFPEDMYTDQSARMLMGEVIREKALQLLREEIPHGIGVEMVEIKTRDNGMMDIHADIYVERDSHKGIVVGKGGAMLKQIGSLARTELEEVMDCRINLQLYVRVKPGWRDSPTAMRDLGYDERQDF